MEGIMILGKLRRKLILAGTVAVLALACGFAPAAGTPQDTEEAQQSDISGDSADPQNDDAEAVIKWLIDKASGGDVDLGDEESINRAIDEAEEEFDTTFDEKERGRIVKALQKMDGLGISTDEMLKQAKKLYQKYGEEVVQEANEAINDAVESAVKSATDNFFQNMKKAVSNFFQDLFSKG